MYHLFFADDLGSAGTDMTFFDFPGIPKGTHGTNEIYKTAFRVPTDAAIDYWLKRFDKYDVKNNGIEEVFGKQSISFVDFDDQLYMLISDESNTGIDSGRPWQNGPLPFDNAIIVLGPIHILISEFHYISAVLQNIMLMREIAEQVAYHLFVVVDRGNGSQLTVVHNTTLPAVPHGFGSMQHVAFPVEDKNVL